MTSVRRPSPDRLILRGYGPLAALLAVLLTITVTVPSKSGKDADEVAVTAASDGEAVEDPVQAAVAVEAAAAGQPVFAAKGGKAATAAAAAALAGTQAVKGSKADQAATRGRNAAAPAAAAAAAAAVTGARAATNCPGGAKQDKISAYSPDCLAFTGNNGGATFRGITKDTITIAMRESPERGPYLGALVRQKVLSFGGIHLPASYYKSKAPYAWGQLIDCTTLMTSAVDLLARRFPAGGKAERSGSAKMREKPRKYGLLVPDDAVYAQCINEARPKLEAARITLTKEITYALDFAKLQQETPNMAAQLKQAGVTTLLLVTDPLLPFFLTGASTQQDFWPEWFVTGTIGTDIDVAGQFYDADQWQFAYGQSYLTALGQGKAAEAYRAYKSMRPDEPTTTADLTYQTLLMLFLGLQQAGPNLTPTSFQQGMYSYGAHTGSLGQWSFGPDDYTPTDDAREVYFDPKAISAFNSKPGRWVVLNGGKRYRGATWPTKAPAAPIPPAAAP